MSVPFGYLETFHIRYYQLDWSCGRTLNPDLLDYKQSRLPNRSTRFCRRPLPALIYTACRQIAASFRKSYGAPSKLVKPLPKRAAYNAFAPCARTTLNKGFCTVHHVKYRADAGRPQSAFYDAQRRGDGYALQAGAVWRTAASSDVLFECALPLSSAILLRAVVVVLVGRMISVDAGKRWNKVGKWCDAKACTYCQHVPWRSSIKKLVIIRRPFARR